MKKWLLILIVFFGGMLKVSALEISSEHAVLYNLNDDTIVYEKNKDGITKIASLTKIMTTLLAIEQIEDLQKTIIVSSTMFKGLYEADAAVIGLVDGQVVTYEDLLYGTFISSGADATRALTISLAGSEDNFVKLMNKKAQELGLTNTHFINATGLDEEGQTSTVDEVAKLLKVALQNDLFKKIFETQIYTLSDGSLKLRSSLYNTSIRYGIDVQNIIGSKTGYTDDAGLCLASVAYDSANDIKYLLVTTKAPVSSERPYHVEDALKVYNYYFSNYKYHNLIEKGEDLIILKTKYSKIKNITIRAIRDVKMHFDNTFDKFKVKINYNGTEKASPKFKKGNKVGTIEVFYENKKIDTIDALIEDSIPFSLIEFIVGNEIILAGIIFLSVLIVMKLKP